MTLAASGKYPLELNFSDQVLDDMQSVAKARLAIGRSGVFSYGFALDFKDDRWVLIDWYSRCPISLGFIAITKGRDLACARADPTNWPRLGPVGVISLSRPSGSAFCLGTLIRA